MGFERIVGPYWAAPRGVVTRQFSAENPDASHGGGARRAPDPSDPDLAHSGPAVDLGRGFKVRPFLRLPAGSEAVLVDADGPGVLTYMFVTTDLADLSSLRLRCRWDGSPEPAVDVPLGAFFGMGHPGRPHEVSSVVAQVAPSRGCSCYWPMPFGRHALVTVENTGAEDASILAYKVVCELGGDQVAAARFHARWSLSRTRLGSANHEMVSISGGRGAYAGTALYWKAFEPGWWGEGEVKFYLDGDSEFPTIVDTGTEDYVGGAWGFGRDDAHGGPLGGKERPFSGPWSGVPLVETDESSARHISMYRWHVPDPIWFANDLRAEVQALGWGPDQRYRVREDEVASVAYWYSL